MTRDLDLAIQKIKEKDYKTARTLLDVIIKENPDDDWAWLWMSQVVETDQERYDCLNKVLNINPNNPHAIHGMKILEARGLKITNKNGSKQSTPSSKIAEAAEDLEEGIKIGETQVEEAVNSTRSNSQENETNEQYTYKTESKFELGEDSIFWLVFIFSGSIILLCTLVILGNVPQMSVWLLTLLAIGIGQGLLLPSPINSFVGFIIVILWVLFRQIAGVWSQEYFVLGLLETIGLGTSIFLATKIQQKWREQIEEINELRGLRKVLVAGEIGTGLIPFEVADLRLIEEIDRAKMFKRPLGLLIIEIEPLPKFNEAKVYLEEIHQAITRQLTSSSLIHDIPFRIKVNQLGLIMPERNWENLYLDADSIANQLRSTTFIQQDGSTQATNKFISLNFGLGTYQGESGGQIDIMRAAKDSLDISRELSAIGEKPISAHAMPAIQILETDLRLSEE